MKRMWMFVMLLLAASPVGSIAGAMDVDSDGIVDEADNCASVANGDQRDTDLDYAGDACDADDDGDLVPDAIDPAPLDSSL